MREISNFAFQLRAAEGRREAGSRPPGELARRYCLVRRELPAANLGPAVKALHKLATAQDESGNAKLFTAYQTMTDRVFTEVWVFDEPGLDPYAGAPIELLGPLDDLSTSISTVLLEPFSYSEAR